MAQSQQVKLPRMPSIANLRPRHEILPAAEESAGEDYEEMEDLRFERMPDDYTESDELIDEEPYGDDGDDEYVDDEYDEADTDYLHFDDEPSGRSSSRTDEL
jgi:hypothetical protein